MGCELAAGGVPACDCGVSGPNERPVCMLMSLCMRQLEKRGSGENCFVVLCKVIYWRDHSMPAHMRVCGHE